MTTAPTIWINAGETSGDLHGQLLVRALRDQCPQARFMGMTGPAMRAEGVETLARTEELSVMGLAEVVTKLPAIWGVLRLIKTHLTARRPDLIVVIDAPDFHFRVIRMARDLGIPVVYYISPKLWAWRAGRAAFLRRHVSRLISILPFEVEFYARRGMTIDYVGHPLLDSVRTPAILETPKNPRRIGVLPGSRKREITSLLPVFSQTATLLATRHPDVEFVLPVAPDMDHAFLRAFWKSPVPITLTDSASRYETMRSCRAIMAASGTVTLESALLETPTVVAYTFAKLTYLLGKFLVNIPYMSLPNLILNAPVFPEFLQHAVHPEALAQALEPWLTNTPEYLYVRERLGALPSLLGGGGATTRAACSILQVLAS